jgi:hypothetical protein
MGRRPSSVVSAYNALLKSALAQKVKGEGLRRRPIAVPDPIVFAQPGTHKASDGHTYTITYDKETTDAE